MPKTYVDFRFIERDAARHLPPGVGHRLGDSVRRVDVAVDDPLYRVIEEVARSRPDSFFTSFDIRRRYSRRELDAAEVLLWIADARFEPPGEVCGTVYDYSASCRFCKTGRVQMTDLVLDFASVPNKDVAISIGGEVVVSERFADIMRAAGVTGAEFRPVQDSGTRSRRRRTPRLQLLALPPPIAVLVPPTQFGIHPFDLDAKGEFRCPLGHTAGLNRLSEVTISRASWSGRDLVATVQHVGNPRYQGLLVPEPLWLISRKLFGILEAERITGSRVEVVRLV